MEKTEERIWGVYNTFENPESINELSEIDIWKTIDNLGGALFWARHDAGKPWAVEVPVEKLLETHYNLEYLVYSTKRFGVEFSREPSAKEHVERSKSYDAWFKFWHEHFNSMDSDLYNQFVEDRTNGKDISKYMPIGSWKDSLIEEELKTRGKK